MRRKLHTALTFSRDDWWLLLQAWALLLVVDLGLRMLPHRRMQRLVASIRADAEEVQADKASATIQHLWQLVGVAARHHLYPMRCLQRALVLQWLLSQRDIVAELRIGVRKDEIGLCAHAWLEHASQPIGETERTMADFVPLAAMETQR